MDTIFFLFIMQTVKFSPNTLYVKLSNKLSLVKTNTKTNIHHIDTETCWYLIINFCICDMTIYCPLLDLLIFASREKKISADYNFDRISTKITLTK